MDSTVKIYIPIKKPVTSDKEISNGATVGYPIVSTKDKKD